MARPGLAERRLAHTPVTPEFAFNAISLFIVLVLGSQFVIGWIGADRSWPIVNYPMYKRAYFDGARLDVDYKVYAVLENGTTVPVRRDELGMDFWIFKTNVVSPLERGDLEALAPLIERYCTQSERRLARLEAFDLGIAISAAGPVTGLEPERIAALDVHCNPGQAR